MNIWPALVSSSTMTLALFGRRSLLAARSANIWAFRISKWARSSGCKVNIKDLWRLYSHLLGRDKRNKTLQTGQVNTAQLNLSVTVNSFFLLLSFRNFSLFFFPLRARSNSCSALDTEEDTEYCSAWNIHAVLYWRSHPLTAALFSLLLGLKPNSLGLGWCSRTF